MDKNLEFLESFLAENDFKISNIWVAWGNNIDYKNKEYFKQSAYCMFQIFEKYKFNYLVVGINKSVNGNPTHPSPQAINQIYKKNQKPKLTQFDLKEYISKFKF